MEAKYKFGHRPARRRRTRFLIVVLISTLILAVVGGVLWLDLRNNTDDTEVQGTSRQVAQLLDEESGVIKIDEPTFTMELPNDWKEIARSSDSNERSITWQSTKKNENNRKLQMYIDAIPKSRSITRLLPLSARGNSFVVGEASTTCSTFTKIGDGTGRQDLDTSAKYQNIGFICALGRSIDNETGTGSVEGLNTISVTGPSKGKHSYFFVFSDRNIQPNINMFYDALKSFKAK